MKSSSTHKDFYDWFRLDHFDFVEVKGDTFQWRFYVMKRIVDKRLRIYGDIKIAQYFIRWRKYKSEYDEWRSIIKLNNYINLIKNYEIKKIISASFERRQRTPQKAFAGIFVDNVISFQHDFRRASQKTSAFIDDVIFSQYESFSSTLRQLLIVILLKPSTASLDISTTLFFRRSERQRLMREWCSESVDLLFLLMIYCYESRILVQKAFSNLLIGERNLDENQ